MELDLRTSWASALVVLGLQWLLTGSSHRRAIDNDRRGLRRKVGGNLSRHRTAGARDQRGRQNQDQSPFRRALARHPRRRKGGQRYRRRRQWIGADHRLPDRRSGDDRARGQCRQTGSGNPGGLRLRQRIRPRPGTDAAGDRANRTGQFGTCGPGRQRDISPRPAASTPRARPRSWRAVALPAIGNT